MSDMLQLVVEIHNTQASMLPVTSQIKRSQSRRQAEAYRTLISQVYCYPCLLLTKELNPSASNGPWSKKRDKILEHSALNLNRPFKDHSVWDEDLIEERSKTLFNVAVKIWPHPSPRFVSNGGYQAKSCFLTPGA